MKPMTVSELNALTTKLIAKGYADHVVQVPSDEEVNDIHPLWNMYSPEDGEKVFFSENGEEKSLPSVVIF